MGAAGWLCRGVQIRIQVVARGWGVLSRVTPGFFRAFCMYNIHVRGSEVRGVRGENQGVLGWGSTTVGRALDKQVKVTGILPRG